MVPSDELRLAYRALRRSAESDPDDVTRSHARGGLSYLDVSIRGQLFPGGLGTVGERGSRGVGVMGAGVGAVVDSREGGNSNGSISAHHPGITML